MPLVFTSKSNNNGILKSYMAMPFKPNTMTQGSEFTNSRNIYIESVQNINTITNTKSNLIRNNGWLSSDSYIQRKKAKAIGKSSTKQGLPKDAELSYKNTDRNIRNSTLARVRGGGCVAPKKKTSVLNTFKSGGSSIINSSP